MFNEFAQNSIPYSSAIHLNNNFWIDQDCPETEPTIIQNPYGTEYTDPVQALYNPITSEMERLANMNEATGIDTDNNASPRHPSIQRAPLLIVLTNVSSQIIGTSLITDILDVLIISENW